MDQDQEESEEEEEEKGRGAQMGSLLRRGLRIGKKVAIAGAAISSAPVVIPPLVVGLAFAFPFGIYFAGFLCTDKVMRALLSDPSSVVVVNGDSQEEEEVKEEEEKDREIDIWPPTIMVEDEEKLNEQDKLGTVVSDLS